MPRSNEISSRQSTLPMQNHYQDIVDDLYNQIHSPYSYYHSQIDNKYHIKKYTLHNKNGEPVDAFVYNPNSKPYPLLEDQAEKCIDSLMLAAKTVLAHEERQETDALDLLRDSCNKKINNLYTFQINSKEDFEEQFTKASKIIEDALSNLAYIWGKNHPQHQTLRKNDYLQFFKAMNNAANEITPDYAKNQILTVDNDPNVNTVQYYERGMLGESGSKQFQTSHARNKAGVPNLIISANGYIDDAGKWIISSPGDFSHASLPPYQLYPPYSISIATGNMLALEKAMRSRLAPAEEKAGTPLTWINVGILTAIDDKDEQNRIYQETILAAERLRSRKNTSFFPITFNFGVNFAAIKQSGMFSAMFSGLTYTYTAEQDFENKRAFFHLQKKILSSLKPIIKKMREGNTTAAAWWKPLFRIYNIYSKLSKSLDAFAEIDNTIKEYAKTYDQAMTAWEKDQTHQQEDAIKAAEAKLNNKKRELAESDTVKQSFAHYIAEYKNAAKQLHALTQSMPRSATEPDKSLEAMTQDVERILQLYCGNTWNQDVNNFQLQANISDLGDHLEMINHYFSPEEGPAHTATSYNCKSRNDRSAVLAVIKDEIRAEHDAKPIMDKAKHLRSSATALTPIYDTRGGGPKFGAKEKFGVYIDPLGHPDRPFAKLQGKTAKWATKQLFRAQISKLEEAVTYNPSASHLSPEKEKDLELKEHQERQYKK